ncbi:MAG: pectin esterase [Burkholderiales bacterium]|nr:pectin esterase [Phycisphaerae bacterium]
MKMLSKIAASILMLMNTQVRAEWTTLTVAADGSGTHASVQAAVDSIPDGSADPVLINIKPGTYKDRIKIERGKPAITIKGLGAAPSDTVLTFDLNAKSVVAPSTQPVGTSGSASVTLTAKNLTIENATFENSAGDNGQAVALKTQGDRGVFRNCRFIGWQDTLLVDDGRQLFENCYIEGRVDFIFGRSTAVFDRCTIRSKNGGYVTAARTKPESKFGYVFLDCNLIGDDKPVPTYLGRPWQWDRGSNAAVVFIRTKMGPHIRAEGWHPWDAKNTSPQDNTRYSEYASTDAEGKPLDISKRVAWSNQLTAEQAAEYTVLNVLKGEDNWDPTSAK